MKMDDVMNALKKYADVCCCGAGGIMEVGLGYHAYITDGEIPGFVMALGAAVILEAAAIHQYRKKREDKSK